MTKELEELRIVFTEHDVQFHVTYRHRSQDKGAEGASVRGRSTQTKGLALQCLFHALERLKTTPNADVAWLGYGTNYTKTTDSIGVDA